MKENQIIRRSIGGRARWNNERRQARRRGGFSHCSRVDNGREGALSSDIVWSYLICKASCATIPPRQPRLRVPRLGPRLNQPEDLQQRHQGPLAEGLWANFAFLRSSSSMTSLVYIVWCIRSLDSGKVLWLWVVGMSFTISYTFVGGATATVHTPWREYKRGDIIRHQGTLRLARRSPGRRRRSEGGRSSGHLGRVCQARDVSEILGFRGTLEATCWRSLR